MGFGLDLTEVHHLVVVFANFLLKNLVCILFPARHALELSEILARGQCILQLVVLVPELLELCRQLLYDVVPLFVETVVLFQLGSHVSLVLLVVGRDFGLPLLENLDFEPTFPGPLLPQVFVELFNRFVLELFNFLKDLLLVELLLGHDPGKGLQEA